MPNPIWTSAVSFGLVSIPVRLYPATESKDVRFNLLHRTDGSRIKERTYCPEDGEYVEWYDLVRGFEVSHGRYIAFTEDDFAQIPLRSTHAIEIAEFIKLEQIDPVYFQRTYYLEPEGLGMKPFALLWRVLRDSGLVAVARHTLRTKEHACILRVYENTIALSPLLYANEVKATEFLQIPADCEVDPEVLEAAKAYVEALGVSFAHNRYADSYRAAFLAVIDAKATDC